MYKIRLLWSVWMVGMAFQAFPQELKPLMMRPKHPIVCYAGKEDHFTFVPPPSEYLQRKTNTMARTGNAVFNVTYTGFTAQAQAAFQKAVDIWSSLISSPVTINIHAEWAPLKTGILGSAIWGSVHANFTNAQRVNTWYPAPLAEKIAQRNLNGTDPDIYATFNSNNPDWYYGLDGKPLAGQYDLVTVVLHEIGHGLGFIDSYNILNGQGSVGVQDTGIPIIFDHYIENSSSQKILLNFTSPSSQLATQLTSKSLFFKSDLVNNPKASIYAPTTFNEGSSISHLDEATYPAKDPQSLMTPTIGASEAIHDPGSLVKNIFSDLGWLFTYINHTPLRDMENVAGSYVVKAVIVSENGPVMTPTLFYNDGSGEKTISMAPTGVPNEYQGSIPGTNAPASYQYYISVNDISNRNYTHPGKRIPAPAGKTEQQYFIFKTGADTQAPRISHVQKYFIMNTDTQLPLDAYISDNAYISSAVVEYSINGAVQPPITLAAGIPDSLYAQSINLGAGLAAGSTIDYRIVAKDNAAITNTTLSPVTGYYKINVVSLAPVQNSYANNFDVPSADFFGNDFNILTPTGFLSPALHTLHPYLKGDGQPHNERNYITQLRVPIRIDVKNPWIKFDDIVLAEPGDPNSLFGDPTFYDYVVVEGSKDGGVTWVPLSDGYDSRLYSDWLAKFDSQKDTQNPPNSTAIGEPALYHTEQINLLASGAFKANDIILVRFRLFSDQLLTGWGWAIDNLKIQVDDVPPQLLHDHFDYLANGTTQLPIQIKAFDKGSGVKTLSVEYRLNGGPVQLYNFPVSFSTSTYTLNLSLNGLVLGDLIEYRINGTDSIGNAGSLPATGFFKTPIIEFSSPVNQYSNDFNGATTDFVGNFYALEKPIGFSTPALVTTHPYPNGFGLNLTSNFTYTLKKPITVNANNPYIRFDEVALVEGHVGGIPYTSPFFKDYVILEGSKDGGQTWLPLLDGYDANLQSAWSTALTNKADGSLSMYKQHAINFLTKGNFAGGDNVILRFRLYADESINGWGWAIDNLHIQDIITGIEQPSPAEAITVYPNPVTQDNLWVRVPASHGPVLIRLLNAQGGEVSRHCVETTGSPVEFAVPVQGLSSGIYLVNVSSLENAVVKKVLIVH